MISKHPYKTEIYDQANSLQACNWVPVGNHPFTSMAFLSSLEESGAVCAESGWLPQHLLLKDGDGQPVAFMPLYLKSHSMGEYVFDQAWAAAYEQAGGQYYPKLLSAVPFTPVTRPPLRLAAKADMAEVEACMIDAAKQITRDNDLSSFHMNFVPEAFAIRHEAPDMLVRNDVQFHWINRGYATFADFLSTLSSRKRKQINRERREALASDIVIRRIAGRDISEANWDAFYAFYRDTGMRKWGQPYLNRAFFSLIGDRMPERLLLVLCERGGKPVAGALNFTSDAVLYGRWWGALEHHPFLHFEACYYQAIEHAITHGLARIEAGAQGPHKLARGYEPVTSWSLHHLPNPGFRRAVARYLNVERRQIIAESKYLADHLPFRSVPPTPKPDMS